MKETLKYTTKDAIAYHEGQIDALSWLLVNAEYNDWRGLCIKKIDELKEK